MCACLYNNKKSFLTIYPHASILHDPFLFDKAAYLCLKEYLIWLFGIFICLQKARQPIEVRTNATVVMIEMSRDEFHDIVKVIFF